MRIFVDTAELHALAADYRSLSGDVGEIGVATAGAWMHALPPPVELVWLGSRSGTVTARAEVLAAELFTEATQLDVDAWETEASESGDGIAASLFGWTSLALGAVDGGWDGFDDWLAVNEWMARGAEKVATELEEVTGFARIVGEPGQILVGLVVAAGAPGHAGTPHSPDPSQTRLWAFPRGKDLNHDGVHDGAAYLSSYLRMTKDLHTNQVALVETAPGRWVVVLRGIDAKDTGKLLSENNVSEAAYEALFDSGVYSRSVLAAIHNAHIPPGSEISFVGHSQGGATAINVARQLTSEYRIGPVVTAGSPIALKLNDYSGEVLAMQNANDFVPHLVGPAHATQNHLVEPVHEENWWELNHDQDLYAKGALDLVHRSGNVDGRNPDGVLRQSDVTSPEPGYPKTLVCDLNVV